MAHLDIYSDVACPWCFIGKRRLEQALDTLPVAERPTIRWHAYQLRPDLPEGTSTKARAMLEQKFGGAARFAAMFERVRTIAGDLGIAYDLDSQLACNTRLAHRAVALARRHGPAAEAAAVEAMFKGHFETGQDLSDIDVVVGLATQAVPVSDAASFKAALQDDAGAVDVDADIDAAQQLGISGVPFFVLNERIGLSGAQEPETFLKFFAEGAAAR